MWLILLAGVAIADRTLPPPALDPFVLAGTDSASAQTLLNRAFPGSASEAIPLVVGDDVALGSGAGAGTLEAVAAAVAAVPGVNAVVTPDDRPDLMSDDGRTAILQLTMAERAAGDKGVGNELLAAATAAAAERSPTARVALGGYLGAQISRTDTRRSEGLGLLLAVIVLFATLRRWWPVLVPLTTAVVAVGIGLNIIELLGRLVYIPDEAPTLGTMLGLGVGIDYALFLVMRHRALLRRGFPVHDSVGRTAGTAGAGMVFAGATLLAAVSGLALTGISFLAWLGYTAAIVVALALLAALTLVPAMLGLLGRRVLPSPDQRALAAGATHSEESDEDLDRGRWARIADGVTRRPWLWTSVALTILLVMAAPMLSMKFQQTDATALPAETPAHRAQDMISQAFGPGYGGPLAIVAQLHRAAEIPDDDEPGDQAGDGSTDPDTTNPDTTDPDPDTTDAAPTDPRARDPRLVSVTDELAASEGIVEVTGPVVSTDGGVVVWRLIPTTGPSDKATEALVRSMREQILPAAMAGADMTAYVGGFTAARTDLSLRIADRLLPFILGVALLSFLLLMVAYRSLVIPAKAAAMNLVSIAAAYGVVVAVFQWGWGASLIGLAGPVPIESYVPMMMFAVLFGLSMDYEVFLLTAFREHFQRTGDILMAVRRGLADTGQLITAAALIMVAVFASFVITDNSIVKMFGVGLATAVLVDATIVRCILVPSLMVLAARWTWWLPAWLDRALPELHIEGDPAQLVTVGAHREPRPEDARPTAGPVGVVVGAAVGWVAGAAVAPVASPMVGAAVAVAATGAAVLAYLPRATPGALGPLTVRLIVLVLGALASWAVHSLVGGLTPSTASNQAVQTGAAILIPLAVVVLTPLRRFAIPMGVGVLSTAMALGAVSVQPLRTVLVAVAVAAAVTRLGAALARATDRTRGRWNPGTALASGDPGTGPDARVDPSDDTHPARRRTPTSPPATPPPPPSGQDDHDGRREPQPDRTAADRGRGVPAGGRRDPCPTGAPRLGRRGGRRAARPAREGSRGRRGWGDR